MIQRKPRFPEFFYVKDDGGPTSGVKAYCLIEWKRVFSIALLRFNSGTREAFHSHAFNAITWFLKGHVREDRKRADGKVYGTYFYSGLKPKFTSRDNVHRVKSYGETWALTFRGP